MEKDKTYQIEMSLNGSDFELFVNGEKYNASGYLQIRYANGSSGWESFKNGNISLGNFSLRNGDQGLKSNITGWDDQHLGSHPFTNISVLDANILGAGDNTPNTPVKSPAPYGAIIMSIVIITTIIMRDNKWIRN
ncbi:hypothetical protein Maeo_0238 [Methanococcus aeolicus Nankai-3]|uniref:Uncharacterized protein n=2 Tax=Methanococcus aeolicus TaxID=42879 RepID=A6UTK6_META3|nr:hypothetical protein Maeo_0238 [Methanococcus aeolicus Nankai-3]